MGERTKIEWTDSTWTPIRAKRKGLSHKLGWHCEHVSEGCRNCYAETLNQRIGTGLEFKPGNHDLVEIFLDQKMLRAPLGWRKPRMVFVCSMTDLFADFVLDEWIDRIFAVMQRSQANTYQVLTKRPHRMRKYIDGLYADADSGNMKWFQRGFVWPLGNKSEMNRDNVVPFRNVWLGTSCEDQATADERIPHLQATPASVRFLSCEPLLGATTPDLAGIGWVICGGESGRDARPMHPAWARGLRDQCAAAGVPFLFKQNGSWVPHKIVPGGDLGGDCRKGLVQYVHRDHHTNAELCLRSSYPCDIYMIRKSKKDAGRLLDGIEHNEFPST